MIAVLLAVHILVITALIVVVLLQRSEGGALFSGGGFMTGRGAANALTRTTSILAAVFFLTSLSLAYIASHRPKEDSLIEQIRNDGAPAEAKDKKENTDLLRSLGSPRPEAEVPAGAPTAAPAAAPTDADLLESAPAAAAPVTEPAAPATGPAAPVSSEPQNQPQ